jgi:hypothetical protein
MMVNIDISSLECEEREVKDFFKRQVEAFCKIKKETEKVRWSDSRYDSLVDSMNEIGSALSSVLQTLTNGNDVYVIDALLPLARTYAENERLFPSVR